MPAFDPIRHARVFDLLDSDCDVAVTHRETEALLCLLRAPRLRGQERERVAYVVIGEGFLLARRNDIVEATLVRVPRRA